MASATELPEVLKPCEAARLLRVGRNRVYELARDGHLRPIRTGGRSLLFSRETISEFIRTGGVEPGQ